MNHELERLIAECRAVSFGPEEKEAQRRSFAYGNTKIEDDRITRDLVDEVAEHQPTAERRLKHEDN